jgi:hypothetical protein
MNFNTREMNCQDHLSIGFIEKGRKTSVVSAFHMPSFEFSAISNPTGSFWSEAGVKLCANTGIQTDHKSTNTLNANSSPVGLI